MVLGLLKKAPEAKNLRNASGAKEMFNLKIKIRNKMTLTGNHTASRQEFSNELQFSSDEPYECDHE